MDIINVLAQIEKLEWYGSPATNMFEQYSDLNTYPPLIVWRYEKRSSTLAEKFHRAINSFNGEIAWKFSDEHKNWVLCPSRVNNRNDLVSLKEADPNYGIRAHAELPKLAEHISNFFDEDERDP